MAIDKIMDPLAAAGAYAKSGTLGAGMPTPSVDGVKFSDLLQNKVQDAIQTIKNSETASAKAITGEIGLTQAVQAVMDADLVLDTASVLRDRMVSAYQEIMRMPI